MRNKFSRILMFAVFFVTAVAVGKYFTSNYMETGGARWVVGGSLDVASGGEIDIESGGAIKIAGTQVSAGAAEINSIAAASQLSDGNLVKKTARATLDCTTSDCSVGTVNLGVALPAKSLIERSYFYVWEQFVDSGSGTVALHCEDANNIFSAADITGLSVGTIQPGVQNSSATMTAAIAAACNITATIATAEQVSGGLNVFVEYVVHD